MSENLQQSPLPTDRQTIQVPQEVLSFVEPICIEETHTPPRFPRAREALTMLRVVTGRTALAGSVALGTLIIQNPGDAHIVTGLPSWGDMDIPSADYCNDQMEEESHDTTTTSEADGSTTSTTEESSEDTPTTITTEPLEDPEDAHANASGSSAHGNQLYRPDQFLRVPEQYYDYFDTEILRHTSSQTGLEYVFYQYGEGRTPHITIETLEALEAIAFPPNTHYFGDEKNEAMHCMQQVLFEDDAQEGRVIPIIIPAGPALIRNGLIQSPEGGGQKGFTMPHADLDFLFWDLNNSYDEFIILTSGRGNPSEYAEIDNELALHELLHKFFEMYKQSTTGSYELNFVPEEAFVSSLSDKAVNDDRLDCITPLVIYGDVEAFMTDFKASCEPYSFGQPFN